MTKAIVILIFLAILVSLGSAGVFLVKDRGKGTRTARALSVRIGASIFLFALLFVLYGFGVISPHGLR